MNICEYEHDEIVYEGRHCPACELKKERDSLADELKLEKENREDLDEQLTPANEDIDRLTPYPLT